MQIFKQTDKNTDKPKKRLNYDRSDKARPLVRRPPLVLRGFWGFVEIVVSVAVMVVVIRGFVFQTYEVFGSSMSPTLSEQDRLIVYKLGRVTSNLFGEYVPKRGEIIVFDSPRNQSLQLVKRVIGLPGERVVVDSGVITVYNEEFPDGFNPDLSYEDSLSKPLTGNVDITVPDGELFVAGDNRAPKKSSDSRNDLGTVPIDNVIGDLILRHLPVSEIDTF